MSLVRNIAYVFCKRFVYQVNGGKILGLVLNSNLCALSNANVASVCKFNPVCTQYSLPLTKTIYKTRSSFGFGRREIVETMVKRGYRQVPQMTFVFFSWILFDSEIRKEKSLEKLDK
jgi:hypothetical protein